MFFQSGESYLKEGGVTEKCSYPHINNGQLGRYTNVSERCW